MQRTVDVMDWTRRPLFMVVCDVAGAGGRSRLAVVVVGVSGV